MICENCQKQCYCKRDKSKMYGLTSSDCYVPFNDLVMPISKPKRDGYQPKKIEGPKKPPKTGSNALKNPVPVLQTTCFPFTNENILRPCFVDGKKALFHMWGNEPYTIENTVSHYYDNIVINESIETYNTTRLIGIVEFEDGTVAEVEPSKIKFATGIFNDYSFDEIEV